jgi:hypothetical protein
MALLIRHPASQHQLSGAGDNVYHSGEATTQTPCWISFLVRCSRFACACSQISDEAVG